MNEDQMIQAARQRDEHAAAALGDHTPVEQVLARISDHYALMAQLAALVEAVAYSRGVHCDCPTSHRLDCPVAEAQELVRKMAAM